jgi:N-acetylmuramoyl-L-alanine amidase
VKIKELKTTNKLFFALLIAVQAYAQTDTTVLVEPQPAISDHGGAKYLVFIDPGHGGKDPGKPRSSPKFKHEKDLALAVSLKLGELLEKKVKNVDVKYTRTTDVFVSLDDRVQMANDSLADIFVSIHFNSNPSASKKGTYCHIYSHKQAASVKLATLIEEEFARVKRVSNGVLDALQRGYNLQVVQYTDMPSVLVECGFLSHTQEEIYANSPKGQSELATAIYRAIKKFVSKPIPNEGRDFYYKVQVLASPTPIANTHPDLKKLAPARIDEHFLPDRVYKYIYTVGREYDKPLIDKLCAEIKKKGYKDAFVVKFEVR